MCMRAVKSDITDDLASATTSSASQASEFWEQQGFIFDMDEGKPSNLNPPNPRRPRSASTSNIIQNHGAREQYTDGSGVSK